MMDQLLLGKPLTSREMQVGRMIAMGYSADVIAKNLGISQKTYDTHRGKVLAKLGVGGSNAAALVLMYYLRNRYVTLSEC